MADQALVVSYQHFKPIKIVKWKIRKGMTVSMNSVVLLFQYSQLEGTEQHKFRSTNAGTVGKIIAQEGAIIQHGDPLFEVQPCIHSTVMKEMCAECGADLRKNEINSTASVPMIHTVPELKVSQELAEKLGKADGDRLLKDSKLVLLVDLDQTLIHTTNDNVPVNMKDVHHFKLSEPSAWYHTRLRPGTSLFLHNISAFFELHICTFGVRNYAHRITNILDPEGKLFSNRVLSRDECFDPTSKKANLKALFPCGDHMVCIIDDREDVWSYASNLIHVKPYHFFKHTGDINAPPGLEKHENDEKDDAVPLTNDSKPKHNDQVLEIFENEDKSSQENSDQVNTSKNSDLNGTNKSDIKNDDNSDEMHCNESLTDESKLEKTNEVEEPNCSQITDKEEPLNKESNSDADKNSSNYDPLIDQEDPDDYLLYLEDILKRIHKAFYEEYVEIKPKVPDLKVIVPGVKRTILKGCNLVFSGLVPTHMRLEESKAYQVARSLGAKVTDLYDENTTHLVAVRPGTMKVNTGKKRKNLHIVTPDWLWTCAERWEHVDEQIFPLSAKGSKNRHPPAHCSSPEHTPTYDSHGAPTLRKRSPSGRFMDTIHPLMSFSRADIADMDKEVAATLDDDDSESDDEGNMWKELKEDDSSSNSDSQPECKRMKFDDKETEIETDTKDTDELPSMKFRRGEDVDSELDIDPNSDSDNNSLDPADEIDDREWNMMGAALEREFLE